MLLTYVLFWLFLFSLFLSVREAALPNHALSEMELSLDGTILKKEEPPQPKVDFEKVYSELIAVSTDDLLRSTTTAKDLVSAASAKLLEQGIDNRVLNETMMHFCRNNDASSQIKGVTIFSTMSSLSLEIFEASYKALIELNTNRNKFVVKAKRRKFSHSSTTVKTNWRPSSTSCVIGMKSLRPCQANARRCYRITTHTWSRWLKYSRKRSNGRKEVSSFSLYVVMAVDY